MVSVVNISTIEKRITSNHTFLFVDTMAPISRFDHRLLAHAIPESTLAIAFIVINPMTFIVFLTTLNCGIKRCLSIAIIRIALYVIDLNKAFVFVCCKTFYDFQ